MSTRQGFYLFLIILAFVFSGCGTNVFEGIESKDTEEANAFDVSKKLDSGDYLWILQNPDKVNAIDYAAAAMGYAGLDSDSLITALNNMAEGEKNDLSAVTSLSINPDALPYLQEAKEKLENELSANPEDPELNFQMVLTSVTRTVTSLAKVMECNNLGDTRDGIQEDEAFELKDYVNYALNPDEGVCGRGETLVNIVSEDVLDMANSLKRTDLGGSDLYETLNAVTTEVDKDSDGTVRDGELKNYLETVLGQ